MKINIKVLFVLSLSVFFIMSSIYFTGAQEETVRAKIGIQIKSADRTMRAKSYDRLKKDDLLRIYVHPERTSHVYVIHTDLKNVTLLNNVQQKIQSSTLVMPSLQEFYQVDGESPTESFTIIISDGEVSEVSEALKDGSVSYKKWVRIEQRLFDENKIDLSQKSEKPFSISGTVRGVSRDGDMDPFVCKLQIFSGKSILVKRYEFKVKK